MKNIEGLFFYLFTTNSPLFQINEAKYVPFHCSQLVEPGTTLYNLIVLVVEPDLTVTV